MPERRATVGSRVGLHARPAALFVKAASELNVEVKIAKPGGKPVSTRSILSVLALNAKGGDEVVLSAEGEADAALDTLVQFLKIDHDDPATARG
jgi:phosphocarrier protein HPr